MNRANLLALQILVAVVSIAAWHIFSTYSFFGVRLLPPFFFSTRSTSARASSMVRRGHDLEAPVDHAGRIDARLRDRLGRRRADRLLVRAQPRVARCSIPT
jgi:hypothetical protein